jgi:hypothetical protein
MLGKVLKPNVWKTQMTNYGAACTLVWLFGIGQKKMFLDVVWFFNEYHVEYG